MGAMRVFIRRNGGPLQAHDMLEGSLMGRRGSGLKHQRAADVAVSNTRPVADARLR